MLNLQKIFHGEDGKTWTWEAKNSKKWIVPLDQDLSSVGSFFRRVQMEKQKRNLRRRTKLKWSHLHLNFVDIRNCRREKSREKGTVRIFSPWNNITLRTRKQVSSRLLSTSHYNEHTWAGKQFLLNSRLIKQTFLRQTIDCHLLKMIS